LLGRRTRLTGVVSGVTRAGGQRVRIEADDHPFGRFRTLARVRTRADGTYRVLLRPARNVRLRAVLVQRRVRTPALTVWTELPATIRRIGAGGERPRARVTVLAPPGAAIRTRRVFFYLASATDTTWRRIDAVRWKRRGRVTLRAMAAFPPGRLGTDDRVLVCTRERRPDPYGEPVALDRSCGAARLPR
jgi:hypothetical protein